ncbi:hypothetical protein TSAR_014217 [Trichomalopsis sarcophagae]|uniref:Immunoglobulin I-set domain-containing protein n=1 Tax=Trichomalopsis sarcophagae TaxID=543379 RepID=A0A232FLQ0_9HYME|nr:hypothetical protein TSAR_014217 [Trichomalopsis sarcophagae]
MTPCLAGRAIDSRRYKETCKEMSMLKYVIEEKREGYKVSMRLTIKGFNENDVGSYSCISSNSLGKVEGVSRLYKITDVNRHGLVRESHRISMLAGLSDAARGSGSKNMNNTDGISNFLQNFHFLNIFIMSLI